MPADSPNTLEDEFGGKYNVPEILEMTDQNRHRF